MRAFVRRLVKTGLIVFGVYLAAGNVFLNTAIGPWAVNRKPERFHLEWSHGVTWWPGFVVLWNVRTKGHVRHVAWEASASRAHGRIAILPLLSRELRLPSIDADDVTASVDRVEQDLPPPPAREGGWLLRFERIATDSPRHVRVGTFDVDVRGSAQFAFTKQLRGGPLEVLPSSAALTDLYVRSGELVLLKDGRLDTTFTLARHRREEASGLAKLGLADGDFHLRARTPGLAVDLDAGKAWRGAIVDDADGGQLDATLKLARGVLEPGGVFDVRLPLRATRDGEHFGDEAMLRIGVVDAGLQVDLGLPPPPGGSGRVQGRFEVAGRRVLDLAVAKDLLAKTSGTLDVDWQFASLDWLTPLLVKAPWLKLEGAGRVDAALKIAQGRLEPGSRASVPEVNLVATLAGHRFSGQARTQASLEKVAAGERATVVLELAHYDIADEAAPDVRLVQGKDLRIELDAAGELHDFRDSATARLRFADATVPDLQPLNAWLPGDAIAFAGGSARIGSDLELDADGHVTRGRVTLAARAMRARFGATALAGDFDLDARIGGSELKARHFDLDGSTLKLRNLSLPGDEGTAGRRWWIDLVADRSRIEATRPFKLDAQARIGMQDIGLLLALYARHKDYPRWALGLLDAGRVDAKGAVRLDGRSLLIDRVEAGNDRFDIKARLRVDRAKPRGDLLMAWRKLALGVELDEGGHEFHLLRARAWYDAQPALIDR